MEDPLRPRSDPISHDNLHAPLPVECVICLLELEEYYIEDLLPHCRHIIENLGFEGGIPCSPTHLKAMYHVMELYHFSDPPIYDPRK